MITLTPTEEQAMQALWKLKQATVKDIRLAMPIPKPPYTTLASTIKNIERKQYIQATPYGNAYQYTPIITEKQYTKHRIQGFVSTYFENSFQDLVTFFAKEKKISAKQLKQIINLIEAGK